MIVIVTVVVLRVAGIVIRLVVVGHDCVRDTAARAATATTIVAKSATLSTNLSGGGVLLPRAEVELVREVVHVVVIVVQH